MPFPVFSPTYQSTQVLRPNRETLVTGNSNEIKRNERNEKSGLSSDLMLSHFCLG
uniref:Uncharacterized protein n=1 Tax=Tetranychus urticae TaxID=32264 RepID=T1KDV5_TETUR